MEKKGAGRMEPEEGLRNRAACKFKVDRWILEPPKSCTENQDPGRTEQEGVEERRDYLSL